MKLLHDDETVCKAEHCTLKHHKPKDFQPGFDPWPGQHTLIKPQEGKDAS